ncbi:MAG: antibiotic biosynthesis monooxygenase [Chloroflexota bacterium]
MHIVLVHIHIKPDSVDAFQTATLHNAINSYKEPGCARFDVIQQQDDPTRFVLIEVYIDEDASAAHKTTAHYKTWRETVADMMAEDRYGVKYNNISPGDEGW